MSSSSGEQEKMGFQATWAMAVGGMVGGGIFSVLGVVIDLAGPWAWLSFLLGGLIAMTGGHSYAELAGKFGEGGGAFTFLRDIHRDGFAGSLSWVLIMGYVLTMSVYAFTFGHYVGHVFNFGAWFPRVAGVGAIGVLVFINLLGVGEAAKVEIVTVWVKVIILAGLAAIGLWQWNPEMLSKGANEPGFTGALIGAASVFMAYEGFQLLAYDYDDIENPQKTLRRAILTAIVSVIVIYITVAIGSAMLVGAGKLVEQKEVALAAAGQQALGDWGLWLVTIAAAFSTASAINATLFATARLTETVAHHDELPEWFERENKEGIPDRAVIGLGGMAAILAAIGSLGSLVEAASLAFLFTFTVVNALAFYEIKRRRWIPVCGALGGVAALVVLIGRLAEHSPWTLVLLGGLSIFAVVGRPIILKHVRTE